MTSSLTIPGGRPIVDAACRDRLEAFVALVRRWNTTIQLVSPRDLPLLWERHVEDALQLVPHLPPAPAAALDLGSGGGFPGLVLAITTGIRFDLVEADGRKAAFLREAARVTGAPVQVHARRSTSLMLPPRPVVTARAVAPLGLLLELASPFLAEDGIGLFLKGGKVDTEIAEARRSWTMDLRQTPSRTTPEGRILDITRLRRKIGTSS